MMAIPAIDLRDGACVQLVGGSFEQERVRISDPLDVATRWRAAGFTRLHVVDLDAAAGRGTNTAVVGALVDDGLACQVGGGIRDESHLERWIKRGSWRVVLGTRAVEDPEWLVAQARRWPRRLVVALDVRDGRLQVRGWTADSPVALGELLARIEGAPLGALLVTAVHVEGRMSGPDLTLLRDIRASTAHHLIGAGGIATIEDLEALDAIRVDAAVVGMALYTGAIDARTVALRFMA